MMTGYKGAVAQNGETLWRTLLTFSITRVLIALLIAGYVGFYSPGPSWASRYVSNYVLAAAYGCLAVAFLISAFRIQRRFSLQVVAQVSVDILFISVLYVATNGDKTGVGILYLLPLAGSAILLRQLLSLLFVSIVTMVVISTSLLKLFYSDTETSTMQPALYAAAFFVIVIVLNRLAVRLVREEGLARQRGDDLTVQLSINRLAMADMSDGMLVLGFDGQLYAGNPAVERMLGLSFADVLSKRYLADYPALEPIASAFDLWRKNMEAPSAHAPEPVYVTINDVEDIELSPAASEWGGRYEGHVRLKLRFAAVDPAATGERRALAFLQDVSEIENQAQQLKLASMGRLTASIAHEVRNPLSSISYATTLLTEEADQPGEVRLLNIISDNVARLNRMIEDILNLSRKSQRQTEASLLLQLVDSTVREFRLTHGLAEETIQLDTRAADEDLVWFDALHFHEVVTNLLTNAIRYASGSPGSLRLMVLRNASDMLELHVQDDGVPISPEVRAHLFEPFYTTSSKGTGLGLFLARELCANNGAKLDYEYRQDDEGQITGRFVIAFASGSPA